MKTSDYIPAELSDKIQNLTPKQIQTYVMNTICGFNSPNDLIATYFSNFRSEELGQMIDKHYKSITKPKTIGEIYIDNFEANQELNKNSIIFAINKNTIIASHLNPLRAYNKLF